MEFKKRRNVSQVGGVRRSSQFGFFVNEYDQSRSHQPVLWAAHEVFCAGFWFYSVYGTLFVSINPCEGTGHGAIVGNLFQNFS